MYYVYVHLTDFKPNVSLTIITSSINEGTNYIASKKNNGSPCIYCFLIVFIWQRITMLHLVSVNFSAVHILDFFSALLNTFFSNKGSKLPIANSRIKKSFCQDVNS